MAKVKHFSIPVLSQVDDEVLKRFKFLSRPLTKRIKDISSHPPRHSYRRRRKLHYPPFEKSQLTKILLRDVWLREQARGNELDSRIFSKEAIDNDSVVGVIIVAEIGEGRFIIVQDTKKRLQISYPDGREESRERWGYPGGHREKDEKLVDTVYREFLEECGVDIRNYRVTPKRVGTITLRRNNAVDVNVKKDAKSAIFYVALPEEVEQKLIPGEEQESLMVVDVDAILFLMEGNSCLFLFNHINAFTLVTHWKKEQSRRQPRR